VPYIYDDRVNDDDVAAALEKVFKMGRVARRKLGLEAREWALQEFGMKRMVDGWRSGLESAIAQHTARRSGTMRTVRLATV
jgi:hypothetical protein